MLTGCEQHTSESSNSEALSSGTTTTASSVTTQSSGTTGTATTSDAITVTNQTTFTAGTDSTSHISSDTTTTDQTTTTTAVISESTQSLTTTTTAASGASDDVTAPILLNGGWGTKVLLGSSFDLDAYVGYADDLDPTPTLTYTGVVDTAVCGTYPITATVTDSAGNALQWNMNIQVVESMPSSGGSDTAARLLFETLVQDYAGENVRFGIDVSKWQGEIDFEAVKNAGCSFIIMRIGYYYGELEEMDEYYLANMKAAKEAGLEVGVYLYTIANTEAEVIENARWINEQLNGMELDFPVVFDWERFSHFQEYDMSIRDLNELFVLFADEMERYGYSAMLYSSKTHLENFWYVQNDYPVWLAHYTDQTDYDGEYALWQMSCRGRIDGIAGDVDFDILYEDRVSW